MSQEEGSENLAVEVGSNVYALKLGDGSEFAEFEPNLLRLTVFHVLGVSRQIGLGYAEAYLLEYFLKHPDEMLSRQELIDHAWRDRVVSQGSLNQAISNLRALLGDDQKRGIIMTVPRHGYQLNGEILIESREWLARKAEILIPTSSSQATEVNVSPRQNSKMRGEHDWSVLILSGAILLLLIALIAGGVNRYFYSLLPPYLIESTNSDSLKLTLIVKDEEELTATRTLLAPMIARMEKLGGGEVLVARSHHYVEFDCLREDGTLHSLRVHQGRINSLEDSYLLECLK